MRVLISDYTDTTLEKCSIPTLFIYLYTLLIQKLQFSIAGLNGDLYKVIGINYKL